MGSFILPFSILNHSNILTFHGQNVSISEGSSGIPGGGEKAGSDYPGPNNLAKHWVVTEQLFFPNIKNELLCGSPPPEWELAYSLRTDQSLLTLTSDVSLFLPLKWGGLFPAPPVLKCIWVLYSPLYLTSNLIALQRDTFLWIALNTQGHTTLCFMSSAV